MDDLPHLQREDTDFAPFGVHLGYIFYKNMGIIQQTASKIPQDTKTYYCWLCIIIYIHILIIYIYIYWNTHCYHLSHHLPIWTVCGKSQLKTYQLHHDWCILAIIAIHSGLSVFIWQTSRWWWHGKIFSGEWAHWTILYGCGQNLTW